MAHLQALLGNELQAKGGSGVAVSSLVDNDLIGLYFSAHWCPPCRGFTPVLADCYKSAKAAGKKWEIVFVSFDRDKKSFDEYYNTMPWLTLPFDSDLKDQLSEKFEVNGIPCLLFFEPKTGELITSDGRDLVESDKSASKFPWK